MKRLLISILLVFILLVSCSTKEREMTAQEYLDLGEKYLLELNYEQAIVMFTRVIEIEPRNERAYLGAAQAHIGMGDEDKAVEVLRLGLAATESESINTMLLSLTELEIEEAEIELAEELETSTQPSEPQKPEYNELAKEMFEMFEAGDRDAAFELYQSAVFQELLETIDPNEFNGYLSSETANVEVLGLSIDSFKYVYYGTFINGKREGDGFYFRISKSEESEMEAYIEGQWAEDKPNGFQKQITYHLAYAVGISVLRTMSGNCIGGLWDGDVIDLRENSEFGNSEFRYTLSNGKYVETLGKAYDGSYIIAYSVNDATYTLKAMDEEQLNRVHGIQPFTPQQ